MQEIRISIKSSQASGGEQEQMEIQTQGTLRSIGGASVIEYADMDTEAPTGTTTLTIRDGMVSMQKKGAIETEFVFEQGKTCSTLYKTPFGEMSVQLLPTHVDARMEEARGKIELEYVLSIAGAQIVNRLNLCYEQC